MTQMQPLMPSPGDKRTELVKVLQRHLNCKGADLKVDGDYGKATTKALEKYGPPPAVAVPPLCAWTSREWSYWNTTDGVATEVEKTYDASGFRPAKLGLFLNDHKDGPTFKPFASETKLVAAIDELATAGVGVTLTAWIWPSMAYLNGLLKYIKPVLADYPGVSLDLDTEMTLASGGRAAAPARAKMATALFAAVSPDRVSINDYTYLQQTTEVILHEGVQLRPQAYSVGESNGTKAAKDNVYWPGETQATAMNQSNWGEFVPCRRVSLGLAAYDPIPGMSKTQQIHDQVAAALWFKPEELWFWQYRNCAGEYGKALAALQQK